MATAAGTAVAHLQLAHGIWVPMATLIVLQPEFGGTINRALQRTAGTVAGAALAGLMLATLNGTMMFEPLLIVLLFAAFFVLRRRYGLGVTFLTPIVVLILATADTSPWRDTLERIVDTILGAALGLGAGYLLGRSGSASACPVWPRGLCGLIAPTWPACSGVSATLKLLPTLGSCVEPLRSRPAMPKRRFSVS